MRAPDKMRKRWFEWSLLPLKALVLLALPFLFFADSKLVPWLKPLDMSLDMLVGWLCLFCAVAFTVAAGFQRFMGLPGGARGSIAFAVLALLLGVTLSPLFVVK
jgi:hypothetical protein